MATCADQPRSSSSGHAAGTGRGFAGPVRTGDLGFRTLVDVTHAKVAIGCHRVVRVMSAFRDTPDRPLVSARGFTVEVAEVNTSEGDETPRAGYRRSAGSPRGEARRRELLDRVTADLAVNGLVDFSLRRAARAAGTTHKVLLYHFAGAEDLHVIRLAEVLLIKAEALARQNDLSGAVDAYNPIRERAGLAPHVLGVDVTSQAEVLAAIDLERRLEGRDYILDDYSIADMASWPWVLIAKPLGQRLEEFPNVAVWRDRIKARPAVRAGVDLGLEHVWRSAGGYSERAFLVNLGITVRP